MNTKIKTIINEELDNLPKEMRVVIDSLDWTTMVEEIAGRHLLFDEEIDNLQIETLLVLVGMEDIDSYASNIENEVGTTEAEANKIREEVAEKILMPIYDKLMENVKKNMINKNPTWNQSVNFILSGGDYSLFLDSRNDTIRNNQ